jgi:hypothetical protein
MYPMAQATYVTSAIGTLITGASAKQFPIPIRAVHAQIAPILAGFVSRTFPLDCDAVEIEDRAGQSNKLFATQLHVTAIADDTGRVA